MSELLTGRIAALKLARSTEKWDTYDVAFDDGSSEKVAHARDQEPLKVGDTIECTKGQWNWLTKAVSNGNGKTSTTGSPAGEKTTERPHRQEAGAEKKSYAPVKTTTAQKDDYWLKKAEYEELKRDPKIEFQSYFAQVISLYAAAIPGLAPASVEEVDGLIDQAFDKARAIYKKVNPKE